MIALSLILVELGAPASESNLILVHEAMQILFPVRKHFLYRWHLATRGVKKRDSNEQHTCSIAQSLLCNVSHEGLQLADTTRLSHHTFQAVPLAICRHTGLWRTQSSTWHARQQ